MTSGDSLNAVTVSDDWTFHASRPATANAWFTELDSRPWHQERSSYWHGGDRDAHVGWCEPDHVWPCTPADRTWMLFALWCEANAGCRAAGEWRGRRVCCHIWLQLKMRCSLSNCCSLLNNNVYLWSTSDTNNGYYIFSGNSVNCWWLKNIKFQLKLNWKLQTYSSL